MDNDAGPKKLSIKAYVKAYGRDRTNKHLRFTETDTDFKDWAVTVQIRRNGETHRVEMFCCPEDQDCEDPECVPKGAACPKC